MKEIKNKSDIITLVIRGMIIAMGIYLVCMLSFYVTGYKNYKFLKLNKEPSNINASAILISFCVYLFLNIKTYIVQLIVGFKKENLYTIDAFKAYLSVFSLESFIFNIVLFGFIPLKRNKMVAPYLLAIAILEFALCAIFFIKLSFFKKDSNAFILTSKTMIEISLMCALGVIFSVLSDLVMPRFPKIMGGTRPSLSMLPIILISLRKGSIPGIITGFLYSIFNILIDGYIVHVGSIFLDYLLPFTLLGLAGLFSNLVKKDQIGYIALATLYVATLRYLCHSISGELFFAKYAPKGVNAVLYSYVYVNLAPVFIGAIISGAILFSLQKYFISEKKKII